MSPALRKRPKPSASVAAPLAHPTHRSSTYLPLATVASQPSADIRLKTGVSR